MKLRAIGSECNPKRGRTRLNVSWSDWGFGI